MGRCFVLRSDAGKAIGYIQQVERTIRCGIQVEINVKRCQLYFVDQNSLVHMSELKNNCVEQVLYEEKYVVSGGCLIMDDVLIASTSEVAKKCIMRYLAQVPKLGSITEEDGKEKSEKALRKENCQFHRNWPPNPCNPELVRLKY